jgi:lysine-specific histone demethylase 1
MILGGYGLVAKGLASTPNSLDIRFNKCVNKITYGSAQDRRTPEIDEPPITIACADGEIIQADAVVVTASLGVLKAGGIAFEPELPERKKEAISRLGFGLLNKVCSFSAILKVGRFSV